MPLSLRFSLPSIANARSPPLLAHAPRRRFALTSPFRVPRSSLRVAAHQHAVVEEETEENGVNGRSLAGCRGAPDEEDAALPSGLRRESMPQHVAVIMDGNRRWARLRGLPVECGYEAGLRSLRLLVELCCRWGIRVLTVFAFSAENWLRPKLEVEFLMGLFEQGVKKEMETFLRDRIRISVIGDVSKLSNSLQQLIVYAEETTKKNDHLQLILAVGYSGRYDIAQACKRVALKVRDGVIEPCDITESLIEQELETNCSEFPCPDLLIRTSGELRVSNFLLWQLAYSELFFTQSLWPDFGEAEFVEALLSFHQRQRRYGN